LALSSGMFHGELSEWKFMPYTPTMNVRGMNMVEMMVNTFIT
jgi:hypothetical protein